MIDLSNANPHWGVDTIFQRMSARVCVENSFGNVSVCEKSWRFLNQTLPSACYLQNSKGQYLTLTGALVNLTDPNAKKVHRRCGERESSLQMRSDCQCVCASTIDGSKLQTSELLISKRSSSIHVGTATHDVRRRRSPRVSRCHFQRRVERVPNGGSVAEVRGLQGHRDTHQQRRRV